ncbi:hypothetical protein [Campylobacter fetus]|uniref:hypothetical protein n=1 Tax=Campylobacter fetus TaxID=196 RepID=UPI00081893FF|nr:hypothetical protein [Campylobacter fetus]
MQNETISFKCEQFFGKNWKFIFWGIIIAVLVIAYEINSIKKAMNELQITVFENNSKVVLTTVDGRAIKVTKTPLKAEYLKQYAISTFVNSYIVSRAVLTENFKKTNIKKPSDILENAKNLQIIYKDFLDPTDKNAVGQFTGYLNWLTDAIARDKLPEYINIKDYTINSFTYTDNTYQIDISVRVATMSYILVKGEYKSDIANIRIIADGDFNLEHSSENNPYGMRVANFKINMVTK